MIIMSLGTTLVGGAVGGWLVWWFVPDLKSTREGKIATWIVRLLVGSAVAIGALQTYLAIHDGATGEFGVPTVDRVATVIQRIVIGVIPASVVLIALAAIVYLLGPAPDDA